MAHRYSYSQLQKYAACPLKYKYHYIDQLVPIQDGPAHDLEFGKAGHAALAVLYSPGGSVRRAQEAFADAYPESSYPTELPSWSQGKSFAGGLAAITAYARQWRDEDEHWEILEVEQLSDPSEDEGRLVKKDLVARDRRDGLVYGWDHKWTGKYLDGVYWSQFDPHSQIRQYVDSIQRKWGHCGGFYINALSLKHRSKAYTPRKGPDKGVQLPAGDWCDFKRMCFNPNAEAVTMERDNFTNMVAKIEHDREHGTWTYNTDQCVRGPIVCEFHKICSAGYSWPRDADLIGAYYREQCIRLAANGDRCQLIPEHEGEHDSTRLPLADFEIEIAEDNIEEGVDA